MESNGPKLLWTSMLWGACWNANSNQRFSDSCGSGWGLESITRSVQAVKRSSNEKKCPVNLPSAQKGTQIYKVFKAVGSLTVHYSTQEPKAPQALLNKLMNNVTGFRGKKNAAGTETQWFFIWMSCESRLRNWLHGVSYSWWQHLHLKSPLLPSLWCQTLEIWKNGHRVKCNLILSIKERQVS